MYALIEKIPCDYKDCWNQPEKYFHWRILTLAQTSQAAHELMRIWPYLNPEYQDKDLDYQQVPAYVEIGKTYGINDIADIKRDALMPKWAEAIGGRVGVTSHWGTFGPENISLPTGSKCTKGPGGILISGDYEIVPEKGHLTIYQRVYNEELQEFVHGAILAKIDGYTKGTGTTRARREVQYLIDEPDSAQERITSGLFPVITPEGIVMSRAIRPEAPLIAEAVPA